jgi:pilus assembly protein Flp/PilA
MAVFMLLKSLCRDTRAATAVEYGLIITMVVLAMVAALQDVANEIISMWQGVESDVTTSDGP